MSILDYKSEIINEVSDMYDNEAAHSSIIFSTNKCQYLSIKAHEEYFFNPNESLYRNILFKIVVNDSVRSLENDSFYIKEHSPESLIKKVGPDTITVYQPTGTIIEIEDKDVIFNNMTHFSSFFINKSLSKEESYSLLISGSFNEIFKKIVKNPSKHVLLINN